MTMPESVMRSGFAWGFFFSGVTPTRLRRSRVPRPHGAEYGRGRHPRTGFLALRHLRQRSRTLTALLLRRTRLREGRVARHRLRIRTAHGVPRCGRDVAVHPAWADRH